jgi:phytoene/squalene synthetase
MKYLFDETSIKCSKNVTATYSTSFSLAVKMLSPSIQEHIHAIYGFVRFADEIVDSFHDYDKETLFNEFEENLNKALERGISLNPILNSFQHVVHQFNIERELINAFMYSMRADLSITDYNTVKDYEQYIYGSADVVGLMCLKVFVNGNQKEYDRLKYSAERLGSAFQKVNFLRDLKDDSELLNRTYFPHLEGQTINSTNKAVIIEEIENDFREAYKGIIQLPIEAKFGVYTAYVYYNKLLQKIKRTAAEELKERRIRISNPVKISLLAQSYFYYKLNLL